MQDSINANRQRHKIQNWKVEETSGPGVDEGSGQGGTRSGKKSRNTSKQDRPRQLLLLNRRGGNRVRK